MSRMPGAAGSPRVPGTTPPGGGGGAVVWEDISITGGPDYNPGAIYRSHTDHGGGEITVVVDDNAGAPGPSTAASWIIPFPAAWRDDGTQYLAIRGESIDALQSVSGAKYWTGISVVDRAGDVTNASAQLVGMCMYFTFANVRELYCLTRTVLSLLSGQACTVNKGLFLPELDNAMTNDLGVIAVAADAGTTRTQSIRDTGTVTGDVKLLFSCGIESAGVKGNTSARVKWQIAAIDWPADP